MMIAIVTVQAIPLLRTPFYMFSRRLASLNSSYACELPAVGLKPRGLKGHGTWQVRIVKPTGPRTAESGRAAPPAALHRPRNSDSAKRAIKGCTFAGRPSTGYGGHPRAIVLLRARSLSVVRELIGLGLTKSRCDWYCLRMIQKGEGPSNYFFLRARGEDRDETTVLYPPHASQT
jgi:hypothetical protein